MVKINLLPWREELKQQRQRDFLSAGGLAVLLTLVILFAVHLYIEGLKEFQESRNQILRGEIALVDKKITEIKSIEEKKNKLLTKIDVIQKLQESRPLIVHLFDEMAKTTPDGVFLTQFAQTEAILTFTGKAESNARVSAFMRAIEASRWLHSPSLNIIQAKEKIKVDQLSDFILLAQLGEKTAAESGEEK
ncbi:MAG: pilus assembly protein PilN [Gammaproteobacteria bacterium HGW-Gammaproteobacteria-3]|nr:MAG: pilus assembly protein PilN [Gammaproteobacteria bacterium HGW-Gammaproteobacteria-3]